MARASEKNRRAELTQQDCEIARMRAELEERIFSPEAVRAAERLEEARKAIDRVAATRDGQISNRSARVQLEAARKQLEAANIMLEKQQGLSKPEAPAPTYLKTVRASYPNGVPKGKIKTAWQECEADCDYNAFRRNLIARGLYTPSPSRRRS